MLTTLVILVLLDAISPSVAFAEDLSSWKSHRGTASSLGQQSQKPLLLPGKSEEVWTDGSVSHLAPDLQDITLLISVEGSIQARNRTSGEYLWTLGQSGGITDPDFRLTPLVQTSSADDNSARDDQEQGLAFAVEPQSGRIYEVSPSEIGSASPLRPLQYSIPQIIDMSPFAFSGDDRIYFGEKEHSLLFIDLKKGQLVHVVPSNASKYDLMCDADVRPRRSFCARPPKPSEVVIKRTDYRLSVSQRRGAGEGPTQRIHLSVYGPIEEDRNMQFHYRYPADNNFMLSLPLGGFLSVQASPSTTGERVGFVPTYRSLEEDGSPIMSVFDIFNLASRGSAMALLQPKLPLQTMNLAGFTHAAASDSHPFVGHTKDGSLFAMSPEWFPSIFFYQTRSKPLS